MLATLPTTNTTSSRNDYARVHIDFETYSECDLAACGEYIYAIDPTTEILCVAFGVNDEPIPCLPADCIPLNATKGAPVNWQLYWLAMNPTVTFVAHKASFEQDIWEQKMVPLGYPPLPPHRWACTMAKCDANGVPGALADAGKFLDLPLQKDPEGAKLIQLLCKPRKPTKVDRRTRITKFEAPELFEALYRYCRRDVGAERLLDAALPDLDLEERETWIIDQEINRRGLQLDMQAVQKAVNLVAINKCKNVLAFRSRIGINPTQRAKFKDWLKSQGFELRNMQAPTLEALLEREDLPEDVRSTLEIYAGSNRNSLAKYSTMLRAADRSGVVRRHLRYHRAHTGRWAGLLVQFQNLFRPAVNIKTAIQAIKGLSYDAFAWVYDDVSEALASAVRGAVVARPHHRLMVGDQSQIEALTVAWLAGQESTLEVKRNGKDLYIAASPAIFGRTIAKTDHDERQTCKAGVLGFGFGGGINALHKTCKSYSVNLSAVVTSIWSSTTYAERQKAEWSVKRYNGRHSKYDRLPAEQALVADVIKQRWRADNPHIVSFWHELQNAAVECVRTGAPVPCRRVVFYIDGTFLRCRLPSGRTLAYPYPHLETDPETGKSTLFYRSSDSKTKFRWVKTWGGTLAENITQAVARDLMVYAIKLLRAEGYHVILTVHDELIVEVPIGYGSLERFKYLMGCLPAWANGVPLEIEAWESDRYGKAA